MNRPIKFRAWDRYSETMGIVRSIEWCPAWDDTPVWKDTHVKGDASLVDVDRDGSGKKCIRANGEAILMQFTGFHDKHGKEIYEGDILQISDWDEVSTNVPKPTAWDKGDVDFRNGAFRIHAFVLAEVVRFVEIIGNIYENPELLNG